MRLNAANTATRTALRDSVCEVAGIHWTELLDRSRTHDAVVRDARSALVYLLRNHTPVRLSYAEIQLVLNRSSHSRLAAVDGRVATLLASATSDARAMRTLIEDTLQRAIAIDRERQAQHA